MAGPKVSLISSRTLPSFRNRFPEEKWMNTFDLHMGTYRAARLIPGLTCFLDVEGSQKAGPHPPPHTFLRT